MVPSALGLGLFGVDLTTPPEKDGRESSRRREPNAEELANNE